MTAVMSIAHEMLKLCDEEDKDEPMPSASRGDIKKAVEIATKTMFNLLGEKSKLEQKWVHR